MSESLSELSRNRLLQAAMEVFAEKGFQAATVREICKLADTNVAAVNYYFRNKQGLYAEALALAFLEAERRYPLDNARNPQLPAEQRLRHFVRMFLHRILDDSTLGHHGKLIAREIAEPTQALEEIVKTVIAPIFTVLADIVPRLTGPGLNKDSIRRCMLSILGQCLMFKHSRPVIDRLCPELIGNPEEIERCAEHIVEFSLLALKRIASRPEEHAT